MGMTSCVLCWYQRIAMFSLVVILGVACYQADQRGAVSHYRWHLTALASRRTTRC